MSYYEEESNYKLLVKTAKALLEQRRKADCCSVLDKGSLQMVCTNYDNWNGGTCEYTLYINLPVNQYSTFTTEEISAIEKDISCTLNEVLKSDQNNSFIVDVSPWFCAQDIDLSKIGGKEGKDKLLSEIAEIIDIMIKVATGGPSFDSVDAQYKSLCASVSQKLKVLNIDNPNRYDSLWDWYRYYSPNLQHYQERRVYIHELYASTQKLLNECVASDKGNTIVVDLKPWERIRRTYIKIKQDAHAASAEEDFQKVGLMCREIVISLGQAVYDKNLHGTTDAEGKEIGSTDGYRMLEAYIKIALKGKHSDEFRAYAKTTNKLANLLIHKRNATKKDMLLIVSATTALINFIGVLEEQYF